MMYNRVQCEFPPGYDGTVLLERLQPVLDPELDESILQLGFIQSLHVHDGHATIVVQLPTSWCATNFAYVMANDMRYKQSIGRGESATGGVRLPAQGLW